jgi:hypothetical protein
LRQRTANHEKETTMIRRTSPPSRRRFIKITAIGLADASFANVFPGSRKSDGPVRSIDQESLLP